MAIRKKKRKVNAKGRNEPPSDRFARLPHSLLKSEAYRSLNAVARAVLVELIMLENGSNNGSLYLSTRDAADRLGMSDERPAMRAFADLVDRGFVRLTKDAHFCIKAADQSRARCWRLTWLPWDNRGPSNDWFDYRAPPETTERKRADLGLRALKSFYQDVTSHRYPAVEFTATNPFHPPQE